MIQRNGVRIRPRLRVLEDRIVPTVFVEVETNNTAASANQVVVPSGSILSQPDEDWLSIHAKMDSKTDRDFFRFSLVQSSTVFLDVDSIETGLSTSLNSVIDIYDSTGFNLISSQNDGYDPQTMIPPEDAVASATNPDPWLAVDMPAGTYIIRVTSFLNGSTGDYHLRALADSNAVSAAPAYSSRPGAAVTIYLDLDGHTANDEWGNYSATPFDLNGVASSFSPAEVLAVQALWKTVAEDFVPLDVNVTTVDPGTITNGTGYRIVITNSAASIIGQNTSNRGASISGSFTGVGVNTGFVFAAAFSDYGGGLSGRVFPTAIEMGNETSGQFAIAVGLRNYGGTNSHSNGILQTPDFGFNREIWSAGPTHSGEAPIIVQDDLNNMNSIGNIPFRPDDHGDTLATATLMTGGSITGIISDRVNDRDLFRVAANKGDFHVWLKVDSQFGNFDGEFRFLDSSGQVLITEDPDISFGLDRVFYVPATDDFFFEIRSDGEPGEIGSYSFEYEYSPVVTPARVTSLIVNGGATQRSRVTQIDLRFSRPLTFPNGTAAAFQINGAGGPTTVSVDLAGSTASQTHVSLGFPNNVGGSLINGLHTLTLSAPDIIDDAANILDGDNDGQPGGNYTFNLHRLFGDFNGNRTVDPLDFAVFRSVFGLSASAGLAFAADANGDGIVNASDFSFFRSNYGVTI